MGFLNRLFGGTDDPPWMIASKLTSEGNHLGAQGKLDRAILCFERAIAAKSDHVPAHLALAVAYREQGAFDRALEVLAASPRTSPELGGFDYSFVIAFLRVSVRLAQHRGADPPADTTDLIEAVEQAHSIGPQRVPKTQSLVAAAVGFDPSAEQREHMKIIKQLRAELAKPRHA